MREFIGFVKGFAAGMCLLFAALTAVIGWAMGLWTAATIDAQKPRQKPDYSRISRR